MALVFDRLSPEGRALAWKGSQAYLESARDNDFAGVFVVSNGLETVQTYTTDRVALKKGLEEAASRATANFSKSADKVAPGRFGDRSPSSSFTASAEERGPATGSTPTNPGGAIPQIPTPGQGSSANAAAYADLATVRLIDRMDRSYEAMMRDEQGYATTNGLLALIDSLSMLPGRKTVVFFAEGLAIPPAVQARFDSVVATANRANRRRLGDVPAGCCGRHLAHGLHAARAHQGFHRAGGPEGQPAISVERSCRAARGVEARRHSVLPPARSAARHRTRWRAWCTTRSARRPGVATSSFVVPPVKPGALVASSLLIVRRSEKLPAGEKTADNPLYFGDLLLYPNLGEPLRKSTDKTLSFFLTVDPAPGGAPTATLEILQKGQSLAQLPMELSKPDATGRIAHAGQLPLASFPPGQYVLRTTVSQGAQKEARDATFTVVE